MSRLLLNIAFLVVPFYGLNLSAQSDTINQKDAAGLKQGYWIFYGKDLPDRGYCDSCKIEEGKFINGKKNGQWIMYHKDGMTPRTKGNFVNGRPKGHYEKINEAGLIIESGNFENGKQVGIFERYYNSGCLAQQRLFDSTGREVYVYFYNDDCHIDTSNVGSIMTNEKPYENVEKKQTIKVQRSSKTFRSGQPYGYYEKYDTLGRLIYYGFHGSNINSFRIEYYPNGCIFNQEVFDTILMKKTTVYYHNDCDLDSSLCGTKDSSINLVLERRSDCDCKELDSANSSSYLRGGPDGSQGITLNKTNFNSNGYNKVYNEDQELWLDGVFKESRLWEGKYYIYDQDGILINIEIWKNGSYCCDGQL